MSRSGLDTDGREDDYLTVRGHDDPYQRQGKVLQSLVCSPFLVMLTHIPLFRQNGSSNDELIRLFLRLTLYTLYETDAFLNTDKIRERSDKLKNVRSFETMNLAILSGCRTLSALITVYCLTERMINVGGSSGGRLLFRAIRRLAVAPGSFVLFARED